MYSEIPWYPEIPGAPIVLAVHGGAWSIPDDKKAAVFIHTRHHVFAGLQVMFFLSPIMSNP
jgi:acetyl esterase/lipase